MTAINDHTDIQTKIFKEIFELLCQNFTQSLKRTFSIIIENAPKNFPSTPLVPEEDQQSWKKWLDCLSKALDRFSILDKNPLAVVMHKRLLWCAKETQEIYCKRVKEIPSLFGSVSLEKSERLEVLASNQLLESALENLLGSHHLLGQVPSETSAQKQFSYSLYQIAQERIPSSYSQYTATLRKIVPFPWFMEEHNPLGIESLADSVSSILELDDFCITETPVSLLVSVALSGPIIQSISLAQTQLNKYGAQYYWMKDTSSEVAHSAKNLEKSLALLEQVCQQTEILHTSAFSGLPLGKRFKPLQPTLQKAIEVEKDAVVFAHKLGIKAYSRASRHEFFSNIRNRLSAAHANDAQLALVDLVSNIFNYVAPDNQIPESLKPLLWRLQHPVLILSLMDVGYISDGPRSFNKLLEYFGSIAKLSSKNLAKNTELHRRLETVVRAVEVTAATLSSRSSAMANQIEKEYERAQKTVQKLVERTKRELSAIESMPNGHDRRDEKNRPSREQEKIVTKRLVTLLNKRIKAHCDTPESVKSFLLNTWLLRLRTEFLRTGKEGEGFKKALEVVDNLLWSVSQKASLNISRQAFAQKISNMIENITEGIRKIGTKEENFQKFFDEIFLIHLHRMQKRTKSPTDTSVQEPKTASDQVFMVEKNPQLIPESLVEKTAHKSSENFGNLSNTSNNSELLQLDLQNNEGLQGKEEIPAFKEDSSDSIISGSQLSSARELISSIKNNTSFDYASSTSEILNDTQNKLSSHNTSPENVSFEIIDNLLANLAAKKSSTFLTEKKPKKSPYNQQLMR